jgi:hypothetical protein
MTPMGQIAQLADELRSVFANERAAIAALDHARLDVLTRDKTRIANELAALRDSAAPSAELRTLLEDLRVEAHATAMLAAVACEAVRMLLGYEPANHAYDRRARCVDRRISQVITRF